MSHYKIGTDLAATIALHICLLELLIESGEVSMGL